MGGLAARLAGERYLGIAVDRERHAADLKAALGGIKGPLMKVAQLLATIPDALPEEYVRELIQLQANAPAMGWPFVRRRMMGELGPDWQSRFASFEHDRGARRLARPGAPRGRARRHAARLQAAIPRHGLGGGGRSAPAQAGDGALRALRPGGHAPPRSTPRSPTGCARNSITSARPRICGSTAKSSRTSPVSRCRAPIAELSTKRLLTMTWLDGGPILDIARRRRSNERNEIGAAHVPHLVRAVLLLRRHPRRPASRQLHGGARTAPSTCSISAASGFSRASSSKGVIDLYHALERDDEELAVACLPKLGLRRICRTR